VAVLAGALLALHVAGGDAGRRVRQPPARLAGSGIALYLTGADGTDRLDVDTGHVTSQGPGLHEVVAVPATAGVAYLRTAPEALFWAAGSPVVLGPASSLVPAAGAGTVWLERRAGREVVLTLMSIGEREPAAGPVVLPAAAAFAGTTMVGPVFTVDRRVYELPASGAAHLVGRGSAVAAGGHHVAIADCSPPGACTLSVLDLPGGRLTRLASPKGATITSGVQGVLSPDGARLAVWLPTDVGGPALYLFDTTGGAAARVPGVAAVAAFGNGSLGWSPDGAWLFVAAGSVRAYHIGDAAPTELALPHDNYHGVVAVG
jgi:hypothetical protein